MKFKDAYYRQKNGFVNPKYTKDDWLKYKDRYYRWATSAKFQDAFGIETKPKCRHRRSISVRDVGRLYNTDIDWLQSKIDYPRWSFDRRVYRKSKNGTVWYGALMRIYFYEDK